MPWSTRLLECYAEALGARQGCEGVDQKVIDRAPPYAMRRNLGPE